VYKVGHSRADLLHQVRDVAIAGDDEQLMLLDRPEYMAIGAETDPEGQVEMLAALVVTTMERLAPAWVTHREAAAVDAEAAADLLTAHQNRQHTFTGVVGAIPECLLRHSPEERAATAWAIASPEVDLLLRSVLAWDTDRYAEWLRTAPAELLLRPSAG